jgi:hypothetical protein
MRIEPILVLCLLLPALAPAAGTDKLAGRSWSPDSEWLALNWPERDELFIISVKSAESFMLRPAGDIRLEEGWVFQPQHGRPADPRRSSKLIAAPGLGRLTLAEWSPDSRAVAYAAAPKMLGIFSIPQETVTARLPAQTPLPWHKPGQLRVDFELVAAAGGRPACLWMRVQRADGTTVKEIAFTEPRELRHMATVRFRDASFLSADSRFVLYPRFSEQGWRLWREPVTAADSARAVSAPGPEPPQLWQLAEDGRFLAVVAGRTLSVGPLEEPARAQTIALEHGSATMKWSPDGRFLAYTDKDSLFLLPREGGERVLVSRSWSSRFWGWRGTRLYFGDVQKGPTELFYVDAEQPGPAARLVRTRHWAVAPRETSISPDGRRLVCVAGDIDYAGRIVWQLWQIALEPGAEWQMLYELRPKLR